MSYNGSGTFQINTSGQPVVTGTVISSSAFNALTADLATGLSTAITKDGQTATTVRIPFAAGINSSLATDTSSGSTGSIITAGGVGIAKALYVGTNATVAGALGVTGVTTVQAGTVAAPAITTSGDTNTGIFFPAADTIAFTKGGAEAMRIDSSGNVGIGTTSPSTYGKFVVAGGDGNTQFNVGTNGVLRIAGYNSTYSGALLESVNTTQSAYLPIAINGSYTVLATGNTERMRIDGSGNVLIGGTTVRNTAKITNEFTGTNGMAFYCVQNTSAVDFAIFTANAGTACGFISRVGTTAAVVYTTTSDYRLKENVIPITGALARVAALKPVTFTWKDGGAAAEGFIAHEFAEVCPNGVTGEKDGVDEGGNPKYQSMDASSAISILVAAMQEQQALITSLTARIAALEAK
jgi:hypothetical protein